MFICDRGTGAQQFRGLVMSEIHRQRPRRYKFEFSFVGNDRRPSQKSGTCRGNRNAPDSPDLSPSISDDRGYLRFPVFISRQNLRQSGKSKIPDRPGFSRHETQALINGGFNKARNHKAKLEKYVWDVELRKYSLNLKSFPVSTVTTVNYRS